MKGFLKQILVNVESLENFASEVGLIAMFCVKLD